MQTNKASYGKFEWIVLYHYQIVRGFFCPFLFIPFIFKLYVIFSCLNSFFRLRNRIAASTLRLHIHNRLLQSQISSFAFYIFFFFCFAWFVIDIEYWQANKKKTLTAKRDFVLFFVIPSFVLWNPVFYSDAGFSLFFFHNIFIDDLYINDSSRIILLCDKTSYWLPTIHGYKWSHDGIIKRKWWKRK